MKKFLLLFSFFGFALWAFGQYRFVENGGQWPGVVNFKASIPGGNFYIENDRFTVDLYDTETTDRVFAAHRGEKPMPVPGKLQCHAYQIIFENCLTPSSVQGKAPFRTSYNYFTGNDPGKWASGLRGFQEVIQADIYAGIDLKIYARTNLKYDFIVRPGADPSDIQLLYKGVNPKLEKDGSLTIETAVGRLTESKPFAYQVIDGKIVSVGCIYRYEDGKIAFDVSEYDTTQPLIIDPELIFSTYSGSFSDNFGYTATYDEDGHLYSGSTAFGNAYPVTTGAYQTTWAGGTGAGTLSGTDIAISKFSLDGTDLLYSTYLGGSGDELPHSLITNEEGELFILGTTGSANYPVTDGAFQTNFQGGAATVLGGIGISYNLGCDIVVSRLSAEGNDLLASTLLGGTANDGVNTSPALRYNYADEVRGEIELDEEGNILVGTSTFSVNFPVTGDAFQPIKDSGQDGVFFSLDPSMENLLYSTFAGGNGNDAVYSIHYANGSTLLGGGTTSTNLPTTGSAFQPDYQGGEADGYLIRLMEGSLDIATYFGTASYDQVYFVERDDEGSVYTYGQTESTSSQLLFNAAYGQAGRGMFISKLLPNLNALEWSTTFGNQIGVPPLSPTAFSVDICNRIYLSGWGGEVNTSGTTSNLEVTDDALKSTTDGSDFYFMVLSSDANNLTFASFYGGNSSSEHVDGGTSRFDRGGKIYQAVCAGCGGNDDFPIAPPNALSPTNNSLNCNLGVAKIDFDLPLVVADFDVENSCLPSPVTFTNTSETFINGNPSYEWTFPNGDTSSEENPVYTFNSPGVYEVQLIISDPLSCNLADTLVQTVEVLPPLELELADSLISCTETSFEITANSFGSAQNFTWATDADFNNVISSGALDSVLVYSPEGPGFIYLEINTPGCNQIDSVLVSPAPSIELTLNDTILCSLDEVEVSALFSGNPDVGELIWTPTEFVVEGQGTANVTVFSDENFVLQVSAESNYGCLLEADASFEVYPISLEVPGDTLACSEDPLELTASSQGTAEQFIWSLDPSFSTVLNPGGDSTISINPSSFTTYFIQVVNEECSLIDSVGVSVLQLGTTVSDNQFICANDTALLTVNSDFPGGQLSHNWQPEEFVISGQGTEVVMVVVPETTTFTVSSSTVGCSVENTVTVFTSPLGNAEVEATATPSVLAAGESSQLSVTPLNTDYTYQWVPDDFLDNPFSPNPVSTPASSITYVVTVFDFTDDGVCAKSDTVVIQIFDLICGNPSIFVPNAFTPNGDGENDVLFVRGKNITDLSFSVFDRWGELVFETEDIGKGWDGTFKGNLAEPAVFVYQLEAVCDDGQEYFEKGNVTLIR